MRTLLALLSLLFAAPAVRAAEIERIWLTHEGAGPESVLVNWETAGPGDSAVEYGPAPAALTMRAEAPGEVALHHVPIDLRALAGACYYRVRSGAEVSAVHCFVGYPPDVLRVAAIADAGYATANWAEAVLAQAPHLLLTAGDNVPALHTGQPVPPETTTAFSRLIAQAPRLFRSTPFLPAAGNHDREIRPRGPQPPPEPVYDISARAFRSMFRPNSEKAYWSFDLPRFGVRFVAADLSHLSDQGTTWQTCPPYAAGGEQFAWYRDAMTGSRHPFLITLYNERNSQVRGLEKGAWGRVIQQGSLAITGFGYFGERAEVEGFQYYNTAVNGTGAKYADPKSVFFASEDNFLLLTFRREPLALRVELRSLKGDVLDAKDFAPRPGSEAP